MSETTGLKKLLYKTLKHEKDYGNSPATSACLFSYYTTEEIRMNVYITILDSSYNIKNISFYLYDYPGNEGKLIGNVIHKIYRSDINAIYDLYKDSVNSNIKSLYINYDTIRKITVCLEILSGNIYELNFDRSSDKSQIVFEEQGLFKTDAINKTMLNLGSPNSDEPWHNDDIYNTNILFTYNPFQIHNEYASDFNGIRFGSGSEKTGTVENGNSYINIYTGDDKDPIYVTQYTHNGEEKYEKANQIILLDKDGNTILGNTVYLNKDFKNDVIKDTIAIVDSNNTEMFGNTGISGIYLKNSSAPSYGSNTSITTDGKIYANYEIKTDGTIYAKNEIKTDYIVYANSADIGSGGITISDSTTTTNIPKLSMTYEEILFKEDNIDRSTISGDNIIFFKDDGKTDSINISRNGSIDAAGTVKALSFNASSDKRLKKNIVDYTPQKSILDLPIKEFDYITTEKHAIGCLAQDLQEFCPEIVDTDEKGYLSIQESKIVYLLLDEVKKLRKELDELKGRE